VVEIGVLVEVLIRVTAGETVAEGVRVGNTVWVGLTGGAAVTVKIFLWVDVGVGIRVPVGESSTGIADVLVGLNGRVGVRVGKTLVFVGVEDEKGIDTIVVVRVGAKSVIGAARVAAAVAGAVGPVTGIATISVAWISAVGLGALLPGERAIVAIGVCRMTVKVARRPSTSLA
jgi:hypothetical protein